MKTKLFPSVKKMLLAQQKLLAAAAERAACARDSHNDPHNDELARRYEASCDAYHAARTAYDKAVARRDTSLLRRYHKDGDDVAHYETLADMAGEGYDTDTLILLFRAGAR